MTTAATPNGPQQIMVDEVFPHRPDTIWRTLTSGDLMGRWLGMTPSGFELVVGNRFTYKTDPAGEWDGTIQCEVLELIPQKRFVYSWRSGHFGNAAYGGPLDTVVTFTMEETNGGTRLRLVHSGFVLPRNGVAFSNMSRGWAGVVPRVGGIATELSVDPVSVVRSSTEWSADDG